MSNINKNTFNGFKNYETWSVALYIKNDENINTYQFSNEEKKQIASYETFINHFGLNNSASHDGIQFLDENLDHNELYELILAIIK